jgi:FkbM family methyltransferase
MRPWLRRSTNALLGPLGLRVVSVGWGPRGPMDSLRRERTKGVVPQQIVDAGASNGSWTRECRQVLPDSRYLLVDPLPAEASPLAAVEAQHPKVRVWQGALGRAPGARALLVHGDQSSFLPSDSFGAHAEHSVEVRTLDSFLGTELLTPPDFIKADVQGFELEVLRGASRCLETTRLLLEVSYRRVYREQVLAHEVIAFVGAEGFRIHDICTYAGRPLDGELTQSDILFARESSPLFANETWC